MIVAVVKVVVVVVVGVGGGWVRPLSIAVDVVFLFTFEIFYSKIDQQPPFIYKSINKWTQLNKNNNSRVAK